MSAAPVIPATSNVPRINDVAPNFTAETTQGTINFHVWIGDGWAILFSHPKDFTPVCTTELGYMAGLEPDFKKRNCKIIGLSVDPVTSHGKWATDIEETQGHKVNYPMIGDPELKIAKLYDMLPAEAGLCRSRSRPTLPELRGFQFEGFLGNRRQFRVRVGAGGELYGGSLAVELCTEGGILDVVVVRFPGCDAILAGWQIAELKSAVL